MLAFDTVILPILQAVKHYSLIYGTHYEVSFTSNGALLTDKRINTLKQFEVRNFQITIDGDKDLHDKVRFFSNGSGSYNIIMKNICKLLSSGIFVVLRINYTGENISTIDSVITNVFSVTTESMRAFLSVSLQQVWQTKAMDLSNEVDQVIESINKHKIKVLKTAFDCVRNPCYADLRYSAVVNFNGDVYKCTAVDFFNVKRDGFLSPEGTIIWENNSNEKRLASRFKRNYACDVCRIRPLCFGGCSQKALNTNNDSSCPYNFNEEQKDRIVLNRFSLFLERKKINK